jgi:glutamine synthetase
LASTCANLKALGFEFDTDTLETMTGLAKLLQDGIAKLDHATYDDSATTAEEECHHRCDVVLPAMLSLRETVDKLEDLIADDLWPLPTYQEMLFIK